MNLGYRILIFVLSLVTLVLCAQAGFAQGHAIQFEWKNLAGQEILMGFHSAGKKYSLDTLRFDEKGRAQRSGEQELFPGVYFLYGSQLYFEFIVKDQHFTLKNGGSGYESLKITGSPENELFKIFQLKMATIQQRQKAILDELTEVSGVDSLALNQELQQAAVQIHQLQDSIIASNKDAFVSRIISMVRGVQPPEPPTDLSALDQAIWRREYIQAHYFDIMDTPGDLKRTPLYKSYVEQYFQHVVLPVPDSINAEIDSWLSWCESDGELYRFWLQHFLETYKDTEIMGMDAVWIHLIEKYCLSGEANWLSDETLQRLSDEVRFIKPNLVGNTAPDFVVRDSAMVMRKLRDLDYKYLVLFFYDPGCGHCQKKTPLLNANKEAIRAMGGEIVGICTTTDREEWRDFIQKFQLDWIHLFDPYGRSDFRVNYNTRTTPQLYVLDRNQKIIAKKLDPENQLVDFLKSYDARTEVAE